MKKLKIVKAASVLFTLIPFAAAFYVMGKLPERIPTHYDLNGIVDGYGSKYSILTLPVICLVISAIMVIVARIYRHEKVERGKISNYEFVHIINLVTLVFFNVINAEIIYTSVKGVTDMSEMPFSFDKVLFVMIGILYIAIGILISKVTSYTNFGVEGEFKNKKTPKRMGIVFVVTGILNIVINLFISKMIVSIAILLITSFISTIWVLVYAACDKKE